MVIVDEYDEVTSDPTYFTPSRLVSASYCANKAALALVSA